ncbi:MAG: ATP12 family protein [Pseudomonadota bacterium]
MSEWSLKRFWTATEIGASDTGFLVTLDGRRVKTPAKADLVLPTRAMAEAVAAEWDAQDGQVNPLTMPFTRSANAAIDKVRHQHEEVATLISDYADSDLLCYRASRPASLVALQVERWDPMLDWAEGALAARLQIRTGLMHEAQDPEVLARLRDRTRAMSEFELAAFHDLVGMSGSIIIGFAVALDEIEAERGWALSRLDEIWQAEQWGRDEEAEEVASQKGKSFVHAKAFFDVSRQS